FRIHEPPDPQKIAEFLALAEGILGTELPKAEGVRPKDLQKILEMVKGREEEPILNYLLLRSLMRARYSVENVGHFGLASPLYLHFTSPIRRYPDLVVHRNVKSVFSRKIRRDDEWIKYLEETASLATTREERAEKAEFELIDLKKLEFMKDKIGEEFKGIVTHITSYGFFVEITEYLTEGFVSVEVLGKPFKHIKERYALVSEDGTEEYRLGQKVIVKVLRVDKSLKRLDLSIVKG
ncbi:ribonuclease R, partial [candidate division KSB1 bacterium]